MDNISNQLKNHSNLSTYASKTINVALSIYTRTKSGYDDLKKHNVICLPSKRTLEKYLSDLRPKEGMDPKSLLLLQDLKSKLKTEKLVGHLMMDEIKLKNGILWNCQNNVVTGFVTEQLDTNNLMKEIIGMNDLYQGKEKQLHVYANQWRFRSTRGIVHSASFYFNPGTLHGEQIASQFFMDVLTLYEAIGVCIVGIVSDAGGGNESFMSKIVDHFNLEVKVLDSFTVNFQHPFDSNRRIFVWLCSTHSLKAARNNVYRSQENKTRQLKLHGVYFGWNEVVEIYNREEEMYNKTQLRQ